MTWASQPLELLFSHVQGRADPQKAIQARSRLSTATSGQEGDDGVATGGRCCCVPEMGIHSLASRAAKLRLLSKPAPRTLCREPAHSAARHWRNETEWIFEALLSFPASGLDLGRVELLGRVGKDVADSLLIAK